MHIHFNPDGSEYTFVDFRKEEVLFDTEFLNTASFVALLETLLGIQSIKKSPQERAAFYHRELKEYLRQHPKNELCNSFKKDPLGTATQCVHWRDALLKTAWDSHIMGISDRLDVLAALEGEKNKNWLGVIDSLNNLLQQNIKKEHVGEMIISLSCPRVQLFPKLRKLMEKLEQEAEVQIKEPSFPSHTGNSNLDKIVRFLSAGESSELNENDSSLEIWHFEQEIETVLYLSNYVAMCKEGREPPFTVWIDEDNKKFDNALRLLNLPVSGAVMRDIIPFTPQVFLSALSLFQTPLNLTHLINYLSFAYHPLENEFAHTLAKQVIRNGGFSLDETLVQDNPFFTTIDAFLKKDKKHKDLYDKMLKRQVTQQEGAIKQEHLLDVTSALLAYVTQSFKRQELNEVQREQLEFLQNILNAFSILVRDENSDKIEYNTIRNWITTLYDKQDHPFTSSQVGAPDIVRAFGDLPVTDKTIWSNFYNCRTKKSIFAFLTEEEKAALQNLEIDLWGSEFEYYEQLILTPFINTTERLVLVLCDKKGTELIAKTPIYLRMINIEKNTEQRANETDEDYKKRCEEEARASKVHFEKCVVKKLKALRGQDPVKRIDNFTHAEEPLTLSNKENLSNFWPKTINTTDLETLIQYPLDFVLDKMARFDNPIAPPAMPIVKGNVFHLMVERLFLPNRSLEDIKKDISDPQKFNKEFERCIRYKGLAWYLPENIAELQVYKQQVRKSLLGLAKYLIDNHLTVHKCEYKFEEALLGDDTIIKGRADMVVADEHGQLSGLDFKWSKRPDKFKEKHIQPEVYQQLLKRAEPERKTGKFIYYIFPDEIIPQREIPANAVSGEEVDIFGTWITNAYRYRKEKFLAGEIENSEGALLESIPYQQEIANKHLYPLPATTESEQEYNTPPRGPKKRTNLYSDYIYFKKELL